MVQEMVREGKKGTEVRCPNCGRTSGWQPLETYRAYTVNPHYMAQLTPVIQCMAESEEGRACMHIFAPTWLAGKMRQDLLAGVVKPE